MLPLHVFVALLIAALCSSSWSSIVVDAIPAPPGTTHSSTYLYHSSSQHHSMGRGRALIPLHGVSASGKMNDQHFINSWLENEEAVDAFLYDASKIFTHVNTSLTTPCYLICRDSSYTKSWTNEDWERHCKPPLRRYLRHFLSWHKSTTAAAIMPFVLLIVVWAIIVCGVSEVFPSITAYLKRASLKSGLLASFASPLALLLTLKTNRALDRLLDARKAWGQMTRATRALAGMSCAYVAPTNGPLALLICRYLAIFPWTLKARLRGESDDEVIHTLLPPEEAEWLLSQNTQRPIAVLSRVRCMLHLALTGSGTSLPVPMSTHIQMCNRLYDLESVVGICNRILGSPIPPTYTRMTSRLLFLYLLALPFALLGFGISPVSAILTTAMTTYVLVGIDEIGIEVEHPFPLLPMQQMSAIAQEGVMGQVQMMKSMPKL